MRMKYKRLIVGNWKMRPETLGEAKEIASKSRRAAASLSSSEVVICPPAVFISACAPRDKAVNFHLGAQSVSDEKGGSHTGEIGAAMMRDMGVEYVIVGHSEEREKGDTDLKVSKRILAILGEKLIPIVCVGEKTRNEDGSHFEYLKNQIKSSLQSVDVKDAKNIIIAYEPVWAIGAVDSMIPEQIYEMVLFVKKVFADIFGNDLAYKTRVLYGGAVSLKNAADIIKVGQADGLLIGRESVNLPGFIPLLKEVDAVPLA